MKANDRNGQFVKLQVINDSNDKAFHVSSLLIGDNTSVHFFGGIPRVGAYFVMLIIVEFIAKKYLKEEFKDRLPKWFAQVRQYVPPYKLNGFFNFFSELTNQDQFVGLHKDIARVIQYCMGLIYGCKKQVIALLFVDTLKIEHIATIRHLSQ